MIVGITGRKQHGKSTVGNLLATRGFRSCAFADNVKSCCATAFQLSHDQLYGDLKEVEDPRWGLTPRTIMQRMGTEVGRAIHPDVWINGLFEQIRAERIEHVAITDVRFPNEADAVRAHGGVVLRVFRPGMPDEDSHASETAMDDIRPDATIINDGTLDELAERVARFLRAPGYAHEAYTVVRHFMSAGTGGFTACGLPDVGLDVTTALFDDRLTCEDCKTALIAVTAGRKSFKK